MGIPHGFLPRIVCERLFAIEKQISWIISDTQMGGRKSPKIPILFSILKNFLIRRLKQEAFSNFNVEKRNS